MVLFLVTFSFVLSARVFFVYDVNHSYKDVNMCIKILKKLSELNFKTGISQKCVICLKTLIIIIPMVTSLKGVFAVDRELKLTIQCIL